MKRLGFLLGLFSVGGQVLLLRELVSSLNGDEQFIGTALFGWLLAVAVGAYWGGRHFQKTDARYLFIFGALLLPVMIIAVRFSPLLFTDITGEIIPFTTAAMISIIAMCPVGLISGWLFPIISRPARYRASEAVVVVYLFEGIGAFVGGIIITVLVSIGESTLVVAISITVLVVAGLMASGHILRRIIVILCTVISIILVMNLVWGVDCYLERLKYEAYEVVSNVYTPYGHHVILDRGGSLTLMTDNSIEAVYPNRETAENHFLVPYIYNPAASKPLYIGLADLIVASLLHGLPFDTIATIDPRRALCRPNLNWLPGEKSIPFRYHYTDAVDYFTSSKDFSLYDIVILNAGLPDNYLSSRFFTSQFLRSVKSKMADSSILSIPLAYDTDRYLTPETEKVLSIIHATLSAEFANVFVWPGTTMIFLASDRLPLNLTYDEIIRRLNEHDRAGDFISDAFLFDRLSDMKVERLHNAIANSGLTNTMEKPILTHYQALYRSMADSTDRRLLNLFLGSPWWILIIPVFIIVMFILVKRREQTRRFGLFLYFTAGVVSLSLELISFYLYQTTAGSLYSHMALLIGAFMLGLAVGTYFSHKTGDGPLEYPALIILLVSTLVFMTTYDDIGPDALLLFHTLFLFVVAIATGTLFVAATNRYYADDRRANRGTGYAWELFGSSLGALFTMTILLPVIGLAWLMLSLAGLLALALIGAVMSNKVLRLY
jgi:MFS family permease